jgi:hypothetical protein
METKDIDALNALPKSATSHRIDFTKAEVVRGIIPNTYFLVVTGMKPWVTMEMKLIPLVYIAQPDYWGIEVIGIQSGIGLPAEAPYSVTLNISHTRGKEGIEVIGASKKEKIKVT